MAKPARNALKGYTFQTYILTLFLAIMDTKRNICKIESECLTTKQFDDIWIQTEDNNCYRVQVKNYPNTTMDDITITDHIVTIGTNKNQYDPSDCNVLVVNTDKINTDTEFMGLPATIKKNITIIPITQDQVADNLDNLFQKEDRELQIILKAYEFTCSAKLLITESDLPEIITLSTDLTNKTILLRQIPEQIKNGINYIVGKPGVGKSHYVEELTKVYSNALVYRFWVSAHDEHLRHRLQYDTFLTDIGLKAFKSPRSFSEDELIDKFSKDDTILIIDGLDHVENYNPHELSYYFSFLELLEKRKIKTVVLSRPMKTSLLWEITELINWNFSETSLYLAARHNICNYEACKKIYECTKGYPIITYFFAEHYNKYGNLNLQTSIDDINIYYSELLKDVSMKSSLCVFASNNSFFTTGELKTFFADPETYTMLMEFIETYPYLFERVQNRISLVHDSLNTYLRCIISSHPQRYEIVKNIVQNSLKTYEVEYMDRLSSFNFDKEFLKQLLIQYSNFNALRKLFSTTLDFNSITSFYQQLQRVLENNKGVLDEYQYYSFVLIFQIVNRNDLFGYEGLIYQILLYLHKHSTIENSIFSSGIMWNVYLLGINRGDLAEKYVSDSMYVNNNCNSMITTLEEEVCFFDCLEKPANFDNIENILEEIKSNSLGGLEKSNLLKQYFVSVWLHGATANPLRYEFGEYWLTEKIDLLLKKLNNTNMDYWDIERAARGARYQLEELGIGAEKNRFRTSNLMDIIEKYAPHGSFEAATIAQSYIRLANYDNRIIDINSINYLWAMYGQRKDYSVYTLDTALILFENQRIISESDSIEILNRLIDQSEKGIRLLLSSYINKKGEKCIKKLIKSGKLFEPSFNVNILDLSPQNIDCLSKDDILSQLIKSFRYHSTFKSLEVSDMENLLSSKHCKYVLEIISFYKYSFTGFTNKELTEIIKSFGISILDNPTSKEKEYVPFENGYIQSADLEYVQKNNIPLKECIKYADGWYSCMPFLSIFEYQDLSYLKENYLDILHDAIFARVLKKRYIGNWDKLIGNIPNFLRICDVSVDWQKMFKILIDFLDCSLIYYPKQKTHKYFKK